jgi:SH3-like domain-containing protein
MSPVTFNRQEPAHTQEHDYDCSQDSLEWALCSLGRKPSDSWLEEHMIADGIMSKADGLLDGSGARLAAWIGEQYGEFGFSANSQATVSFQQLADEIGRYPMLIGGHNWGGPHKGHWSGLSGYDPARDVLLLANPGGTGPIYGGQEMTRQQFDARGPFSTVRVLHPDLGDGVVGTGSEQGQAGAYRVTEAGVRMRAAPGTSASVVIEGLDAGSVVNGVDDQVVSVDGHRWRHVRLGGTVGWVAAEFLAAIGPVPEPGGDDDRREATGTRFSLTQAGVRMRTQPSTSATIVVNDLGPGTTVTALNDRVVTADGHDWRNVQTAAGQAGWVASEFLQPVEDGGELSNAPDHFFGFEILWPHIQAAAGEFGADARMIAAIMKQESGFQNRRVHDDHTGHGLFGFDDNGLLPDFEQWSGLACGRGDNAISIPPGPQIRYCAKTVAAFTSTFGSAINAARVWHRGPSLWRDARGDNYEELMRAHIRSLFGS